MSESFQTAVTKHISRDVRVDAIDRLIRDGDRTNLAVLVKTDGLNGAFRRQALDGLAACGGTEELESLSDNPGVPDSLQKRASRLR